MGTRLEAAVKGERTAAFLCARHDDLHTVGRQHPQGCGIDGRPKHALYAPREQRHASPSLAHRPHLSRQGRRPWNARRHSRRISVHGGGHDGRERMRHAPSQQGRTEPRRRLEDPEQQGSPQPRDDGPHAPLVRGTRGTESADHGSGHQRGRLSRTPGSQGSDRCRGGSRRSPGPLRAPVSSARCVRAANPFPRRGRGKSGKRPGRSRSARMQTPPATWRRRSRRACRSGSDAAQMTLTFREMWPSLVRQPAKTLLRIEHAAHADLEAVRFDASDQRPRDRPTYHESNPIAFRQPSRKVCCIIGNGCPCDTATAGESRRNGPITQRWRRDLHQSRGRRRPAEFAGLRPEVRIRVTLEPLRIPRPVAWSRSARARSAAAVPATRIHRVPRCRSRSQPRRSGRARWRAPYRRRRQGRRSARAGSCTRRATGRL